MKKLYILSPSTTDVGDFIEYYASTNGDIDTCKRLFILSKLRQTQVKVDAQTQHIASQAPNHAEQMKVQAQHITSQARLDISIDREIKRASELILVTDKLADVFKSTHAMLLGFQQGMNITQNKKKRKTAKEILITARINKAKAESTAKVVQSTRLQLE